MLSHEQWTSEQSSNKNEMTHDRTSRGSSAGWGGDDGGVGWGAEFPYQAAVRERTEVAFFRHFKTLGSNYRPE